MIDSRGVTLPIPQNNCCQKKYFKSNYFQLIGLLFNFFFAGVYLLQFFADLYPVFPNRYLHCVNSAKILACETFVVAKKNAMKLTDNQNLQAPKANALVESLSVEVFF